MRGVVWFRRDLRLADQPALTAACEECDEVIPLFVFDEPLLQSQTFGSACVNFMFRITSYNVCYTKLLRIWLGGTGTYVDRLTVGEKRVIRGGSWIAPEGTLKTTHRFWNHPLNNSYGVGLGFRCARRNNFV